MAKEPTSWGAAVTRVAGSKLVTTSGNGAIVLEGGVGKNTWRGTGGGPSVQEDVAGAEALRKGQETIGEGTRGALYVKSGQHTRVGLTGTA